MSSPVTMKLDPEAFPDLPCPEGFTLVVEAQQDGTTTLTAKFNIRAVEVIEKDSADTAAADLSKKAMERIVAYIRRHFCGLTVWPVEERV